MFFERFREAAARLPAGLIRPGPPAPAAAVARAEAARGPLPSEYASFLRSFDGADLFHEAIVIAGVGPGAGRRLEEMNAPHPDPVPAGRGEGESAESLSLRGGERVRVRGELVFAETAAGDRFAFDPDGRIRRLRAGSAERALAGSSFGRWLDATVAREQLLYGPDGEFAPDAFDADGEEVVPVVALRQAERALRADPGSAEAQHERGVALRRLGKPAAALEAFAAATALDPDNPWPWFALGRVALELGDRGRAAEAFRRAAREPSLAEGLRRAAGQAAADGDAAARAEAEALLAALAAAAGGTAPVRLPVLSEPAAPPRPPARPRRPRPAGPPRSGSPRRGGRSRRR